MDANPVSSENINLLAPLSRKVEARRTRWLLTRLLVGGVGAVQITCGLVSLILRGLGFQVYAVLLFSLAHNKYSVDCADQFLAWTAVGGVSLCYALRLYFVPDAQDWELYERVKISLYVHNYFFLTLFCSFFAFSSLALQFHLD